MSAPKTSVTVSVPDGATGLTIVDGGLRSVAHGFGSITVDLEPGVYKARSRVGADAVEHCFAVEPEAAPMTVSIDAVRFSSPVPLGQTRTTREYQEVAHGRVLDAPRVDAGSGAELLLVVRDFGMMPDEPPAGDRAANQAALQGFALRRIADGATVFDPGSAWTTDIRAGYGGVRAVLDPGAYVLSSQPVDGPPRHQAIYAVPGRRTDVFISCDRTGRAADPLQPRMADLAVSMPAIASRFDPADPTLRRLEVARQALRRGRRVLERAALEDFIRSGAANPMLALYAAHLARFEAADVKPRLLESALSVLIDQCGKGMPDLVALQCDGSCPSPRTAAIEMPPMLWHGWTLAVRAKIGARTGAVAERSFAESIGGDVFPSGDWLAWQTPDWRPGTRVAPRSEQAARLRKAESSLRPPGLHGFAFWAGPASAAATAAAVSGGVSTAVAAIIGAGIVAAYLTAKAREFDLDRLSGALLTAPWDKLANDLESVELTPLQSALLPTLVSVKRQTAIENSPIRDPAKIVAAALRELTTTPSAIAEAVVGLLEIAVRQKQRPNERRQEARVSGQSGT